MDYSKYHQAIKQEMDKLAQNPKVIFLGQQCVSENFYETLSDIPLHSRMEIPVAEEMQMGLSIGLALEGFIPVCIYQRMDFLPRAMDQIVNHLNLIHRLSRGKFSPFVIIRTTIGTKIPLDAGMQHTQNLSLMMRFAVDFPVIEVNTPEEVHKAYELAIKEEIPVLIIEKQELYYEKDKND